MCPARIAKGSESRTSSPADPSTIDSYNSETRRRRSSGPASRKARTRTVPACVGGGANTCVPGTPSTEVCGNGIDDDCDGAVDNGCRRVHIELAPSIQTECPGGGWYLEYYRWDTGVAVRSPTPGTPIDFIVPPPYSYRGTLGFSAWCPTLVSGSNWRIWTNWTGQPARNAGVASIVVDGVELADMEALVCNYFQNCPYGQPSYWTSPRVPLDASFNGRCEASPVQCPDWCRDSTCR